MPHKKNPVRSERISGLVRIVRSNLHVAMENIPLWHERDISHSSAERVIIPDSFIITDYLLAEISDLLGNWNVNQERMKKNIGLTKGLIFSQRVMLALTKKDVSRETAYQLVQQNSLKAWNKNLDFRDLVLKDPAISKKLSEAEIKECFTLDPYLEKIDYIFDRVFADED